jgi:3-hydroxybutyryl-CoA dehydrogenase
MKGILESIGKNVVLVKNSPGFIVNKLLIPMINEAAKLLDQNIASVEDIDKAMKFGANHPIGPLKLSDLIGNDIVLSILYNLIENSNSDIQIAKSLIKRVKNNQLGRKTKIGFYHYL